MLNINKIKAGFVFVLIYFTVSGVLDDQNMKYLSLDSASTANGDSSRYHLFS